MSSNRAIVVCGATGMVGSHLTAQLLKEGYNNITVISRSKKATQRLKDRLFACGVGDRFGEITVAMGRLDNVAFLTETFSRDSIIYNCAATVSFSRNNGGEIVRDNTNITASIVEAIRRSGADLLIHTSSIAALDSSSHKIVDESATISSLKGRSPYAISKFYSESEIEKARVAGLKAIVVQPSVILGGGDWSMGHISGLFKMIYNRMPFTFGGVTGYVDVEDVARAMISLANEPNAIGEKYIINGANLSYLELFSSIAKGLEVERRYIKVSNRVLVAATKIIRKLEWLAIPTPIDSTTLECLYSEQRYDGSKVESQTPFRYSDIDSTTSRIAKEFLRSQE